MKRKKANYIKEFSFIVKASSDVNRIRILHALDEKQMCVCELSFIIGITQPSVSRHLLKLKKAGFINKRQNGFWTDYYLDLQNEYARDFMNNLKEWLCSDEVIKSDKKRIKLADRSKLCR